jgi:DUF2075 family protein
MTFENAFEIRRYDFNPELIGAIDDLHYAKDLWPIVYILSDGEISEAYVGETTDAFARMNSHLKNNAKNRLTAVHFITSKKFNKSATLDIESNLIKYISGDGKYKLLNANIGLANHTYYQKEEVYWDVFKSIWNKLRAEGITEHPIEYIDNSDLFKYSPYKSLTPEQKEGLMAIIDGLLDKNFKNIIIDGGAGTGKTILAVFLFKLLRSDITEFNFKDFGQDEVAFITKVKMLQDRYPNPDMALVVPMSSFRDTLKKVFKNIKGLSASMVIGPAETANQKFDIIIIDESHRLRRRVNLGAYFGSFDIVCEKLGVDPNTTSELEWIKKQSQKAIFFYDSGQSIKPSDTRQADFDQLKSLASTKVETLKSQFRVKGGNGYIRHIDSLLNYRPQQADGPVSFKNYEFLFFDNIEDLVNQIKQKDTEYGLSRLVAGYSWKWASKNGKAAFDIPIENLYLRWNTTNKDWVNSENAVNEVGCIHTTQGYDLNYTGVIFGKEITYDKAHNEIRIIKEHYHDQTGRNSIENPEELKKYILNIYSTILKRGIRGTYIYACDENFRAYLSQFIPVFGAQPTREMAQQETGQEAKRVRLFDLKAAAGGFSEEQRVEDYEWIALPGHLKPSDDLFACKVEGESMNKVIPNGAICLFRRDSGGSRNGKIVLVEHTKIQESEYGGYTVKEYYSHKSVEETQWGHEYIRLSPRSFDPEYQDIILTEDELVSLRVVGVFECVVLRGNKV